MKSIDNNSPVYKAHISSKLQYNTNRSLSCYESVETSAYDSGVIVNQIQKINDETNFLHQKMHIMQNQFCQLLDEERQQWEQDRADAVQKLKEENESLQNTIRSQRKIIQQLRDTHLQPVSDISQESSPFFESLCKKIYSEFELRLETIKKRFEKSILERSFEAESLSITVCHLQDKLKSIPSLQSHVLSLHRQLSESQGKVRDMKAQEADQICQIFDMQQQGSNYLTLVKSLQISSHRGGETSNRDHSWQKENFDINSSKVSIPIAKLSQFDFNHNSVFLERDIDKETTSKKESTVERNLRQEFGRNNYKSYRS